MIDKILKLVPSASLIDSSGGNLFFLIPFTKTADLKQFFKITESELHELDQDCKNLRANIKDWGLSHPTLEEVFLKLTNVSEEKEVQRKH